ncbi:NAD+ synthase [bacterium]|nr:NAD+ synthase [bacterium]
MRVALAQINSRVGDLEGNFQKAKASYDAASAEGADVVLFPEQTFAGYPAKDLLTRDGFIRRNAEIVEAFARLTSSGPVAVVGYPERHDGPGHRLYNTAAVCRGGAVTDRYRKWLLPTYDVFDEDRYFDEGQTPLVIEVRGRRLGVTVCEDIWNDELYWSNRLYERNPIAAASKAGAEILLNISASPFTLAKRGVRKAMMASAARTHGLPIAQVNLVGANDDLVFDGVSMAFDSEGRQIAQARDFEDDLLIVDFAGAENRIEKDAPEIEQLRRALVLGIRDYVRKCGFAKVLIGLSGGIDSALVAALAVEALGPANVTGVAMPSRYSSDHSKSDAQLLATALGIECRMLPIEPMFAAATAEIEKHFVGGNRKIAFENLQSRLRGLSLMTLSNESGALVLTTGNKSEMSVGYATLYGDMCGGLAPIADVPKLMVYELSQHINTSAGREIIPHGTLTKPPSAELAPDQKDTDSLPPYEILDPIVRAYVEEGLDGPEIVARGFEEETVRRVLRLIHINEYKRRQSAPTLKVTGRAFGYGWRMPIAKSI